MLGGISTSNRKLGVITEEVEILFSSKTMNTTAVWEPQGRELQQESAKWGTRWLAGLVKRMKSFSCRLWIQVQLRLLYWLKVMVICSGARLDFEVLAYKIEKKRPLMNEEAKASVTTDGEG